MKFLNTPKKIFGDRFVKEETQNYSSDWADRGNESRGEERSDPHRSVPPLYIPPIPPPWPYPLLDNQGGIMPVEPEDEPGCPGCPGGGND